MPLTGSIINKQLSDAYTRIENELVQQQSRASQVDARRGELVSDRGDAMLRLAEYYLPELTPSAIEETWVEIRPAMNVILEEQFDAIDSIQKRTRELADRRVGAEETLIDLNAALDEGVGQRDRLLEEIEQRLLADAKYVDLSKKAAMAEAALERAEANLGEIEQDAAKKLPAYDESSLFRYLRDRQFGTPKYTKRGFTRRGDRFVAKLIDYSKAKRSYDFLKKTPDRMKKIIADDQNALAVIMDQLESTRDEVAAEVGLPEHIESMSSIRTSRDQLLETLSDVNRNADIAHQELADASAPTGTYHERAIKEFREMISRLDSRDLQKRARQTVDIRDDQIVATVIGIDQQLDRQDDLANEHFNRVQKDREYLAKLGRVIEQFRAAEFDSDRSLFTDSIDIDGTIARTRASGDPSELWRTMQSNQRWGPTAMEKVAQVAAHPATQVLVQTMAQAAGAALESYARNAGRRRGGGYSRRSRRRGPWDGWGRGW